MSAVLTGVIFVIAAALIGAIGLFLKLRLFPAPTDAEPPEDVVGYVTMMVGVLFALILGLSLVAVWENHDNADSNVRTEASALDETNQLAAALPPATAAQVHTATDAYATYVVEHEWPLMAEGKPLGDKGWTLLQNVRNVYYGVSPVTVAQQNIVGDALTQLSTLADARRGRESDAAERMPSELWIGLILGALLTISLTFVYGMERRLTHITMVMGLTGLIGFVLILIYNLDNPFSHGLGTDPDAFIRYFPRA